MSELRLYMDLLESVGSSSKTMSMVKLPSGNNSFSPVLSSALIQFHYGKLYKGYVDRYNNKEGDRSFNEAGAKLHELYFEQFKTRSASNRPTGAILDLINREFGNFADFRTAFAEAGSKVQGSGWVYMNRSGKLKEIKNHRIPSDNVIIIVDMWEHAYQNDYHSDKKKYIDSLWKIVNWSTINSRL